MSETKLNGLLCCLILTFHSSTGENVRWSAGTIGNDYDADDHEFDHQHTIRVSHDGNIIDNTLTERGRYGNIEVEVNAFKQTFILDLKLNKYLFASTYVEKSISDTETTYHEINHKENNCYYIGTVRDRKQSTAAVSTCRGIVGYFAVGNVSYHIEPRSERLHGPHLLYRSLGKSNKTYGCGTEHIAIKNLLKSSKSKTSRLKRTFEWPQDRDKIDKVVEVYVANDNSQYKARASNQNTVFQRAKDIINIASSAYQTVGIYLVLVGAEVWTESDPFAITDSAVDATLGSWYTYRMTKITPIHYNDDAVLITNIGFYQGVIGKAIIGSICSNKYSGALISDLKSSAAFAASTVAHEMGHNFGLVHDSDACGCVDRGGRCIMYASSNPSIPATNWSQCSVDQFQSAFKQGRDICLYDVPETIYLPTVTLCGNGLVEDGEDCDCGRAPSAECNNACCNSTTCKFTAAATCSTGRCCDISKCQMQSTGSVCRLKTEFCDLTEFCDGQTADCPADTYQRDGTNCTVNGGYAFCYGGQCRTQSTQCELLWGPGTPDSSTVCYHQFNDNGAHYGNCGMTWLPNVTFIPCAKSDVMCGKLMCDTTGKSLAKYTDYYLLSSAEISSYICNSVIFDFGLRVQDPGLVPNGAQCGDGMMCVSQKCVSANSVSKTSCNTPCASDELCNNLGYCQNLNGPTGTSQGDSSNKALTIGLCILFLLILPLIAVGAFLAYRNRKEIEKRLRFPRTKPRTGQPTIPTVAGSVDAQGFSNRHLDPSYPNGAQPTRSAPPPPPSAPYRTQVPSVSRAHPVIPYGYDNDGAVLPTSELSPAEQNSYNISRQHRLPPLPQAPTNRPERGGGGRPTPPVKPTGLRPTQPGGGRPVPPPRPVNRLGWDDPNQYGM